MQRQQLIHARRVYPRSISHDNVVLSRPTPVGAPVAGSSKETLTPGPARIAYLRSKSCGWAGCDLPHNHDKSVGGIPEQDGHCRLSNDLVIIAHDPRVQALLDKLEIAWGTQFEIARGVLSGSWTWDDVTEDLLEQLRGSNAESAVKVRPVLKQAAISGVVANFNI